MYVPDINGAVDVCHKDAERRTGGSVSPCWRRPKIGSMKKCIPDKSEDIKLRSNDNKQKKNSGALVRQRTIPTERPPLVGEVSANFSGQRVSRGQRNESPRPLTQKEKREKIILRSCYPLLLY
jgi:hypothetical protein